MMHEDNVTSTTYTYVEGNKLSFRSLFNLYFRPTRFFSSYIALGKTKYLLLIGWLVGISNAIDRLDKKILQAQSPNKASLELVLSKIIDSWFTFWPFVLIVGALGGLSLYLIAGWWYNVRLNWAGAKGHDKFTGRIIYLYSSIIVAFPLVMYTISLMFFYSNYREAFYADELFSLGLLIFPFWSVIVSYKGINVAFNVIKWKARIWFLILPIMLYIVSLGAVTIIMAFLAHQ